MAEKSIQKILCESMYSFMQGKTHEITSSWKNLGFANEKDFYVQILSDVNVAAWTVAEMCANWMKHNYTQDYFIDGEDEYGNVVFKIKDESGKLRYFIIEYGPEYDIFEVEKSEILIPKTIYKIKKDYHG